MFRETLLESANSRRKRNRWPMILAFTAEIIVAALLVTLSLFSTGIIPVSAREVVLPFSPVRLVPRPPVANSDPKFHSGPAFGEHVVTIATTIHNGPFFGRTLPTCCDEPSADPTIFGSGDRALPKDLLPGNHKPPEQQRPDRVLRSTISEGQLMIRVEPIYPHMAVITGTQGLIKLHAIIAKDGTIQSLTVVNGSPMLAAAAIDAVRQWRYKPYLLNGNAVEVETFITVNFKKTNN
jgi:protein TonB